MIMEFKIRCIDVGRINERYFINRVSGGFGSNVGDRVSQSQRRCLKAGLLYGRSPDFSKKGVETLKVRFDSDAVSGRKGSHQFYGIEYLCRLLNVPLGLPEKDPDDGTLDVMIVKKMDLGQMPGLGIQALTKNGEAPKGASFQNGAFGLNRQVIRILLLIMMVRFLESFRWSFPSYRRL